MPHEATPQDIGELRENIQCEFGQGIWKGVGTNIILNYI